MKTKTLKGTLGALIVCLLIAVCGITLIGCGKGNGDGKLQTTATIDNVHYRLTTKLATYDSYYYLNPEYAIDYDLNIELSIQNNNDFDTAMSYNAFKVVSNNSAVTFNEGAFLGTTTYITTSSSYLEMPANFTRLLTIDPTVRVYTYKDLIDESREKAQEILKGTKFSVYYADILVCECYLDV